MLVMMAMMVMTIEFDSRPLSSIILNLGLNRTLRCMAAGVHLGKERVEAEMGVEDGQLREKWGSPFPSRL